MLLPLGDCSESSSRTGATTKPVCSAPPHSELETPCGLLFPHLLACFSDRRKRPWDSCKFWWPAITTLLSDKCPVVCCCSGAQWCLTLRNPMDCSTPGFPVLHHLPELAQTHVHWVGDTIQPSHPLSPPSPPALNLSQHQGLFQGVGSLHQVAKVLELQLQHQSFQWVLRVDFLYDWLVWSPCHPRRSKLKLKLSSQLKP